MNPAAPALFSTDLFVPRYRALAAGEWTLSVAPMCIVPGYWSGPMMVRDMAALVRGGEAWMTTTPLEIESQEIGVRLARGHVLVCGLGLGWAAAATACRPDVDRVTVIECDPEVLALHRELGLLAQLPEPARVKLQLIEADAYAYVPEQPVDLLMPDIWLPLVNDGRIEEVRRMQANVAAAAVYFWGQELEIARHAAASGRALDGDGIKATIAEFALPLIGPAYPDYPNKLTAAARRWMRGRWLPGTQPPL